MAKLKIGGEAANNEMYEIGDPLETGQMVHYVLNKGVSTGQCRPAVIIKAWSVALGSVQLQVFTDGQNDMLENIVWRTSVLPGEVNGSWHPINKCPFGRRDTT